MGFEDQRPSQNFRFLGGALTSICHFFCPSVCLLISHHISRAARQVIIIFRTHVYNDDISRHFFQIFKILIVWVDRKYKGKN